MMLRYVKGYIFEGHTFVVNKSDIHNAKDEQFEEGAALMPDGWISVKDRLPESSGSYIVCSGKSRTVFTAHFWARDNRWSGRSLNLTITHWMPLPEPPKEGKQ